MGETMKQRGMAKKISACAFGALAAVMLAPTTVARADQTDEDFTSYLQAHGVNLGSPAMDVKAAQMMCKDLNAGFTQKDEIDQLTGAHRLNQSQAEMFVGAATADYCPGKHPAAKPSSK
jgi:Spy/CpxP family protein refolding chaperone